jgi:hypothetical protein
MYGQQNIHSAASTTTFIDLRNELCDVGQIVVDPSFCGPSVINRTSCAEGVKDVGIPGVAKHGYLIATGKESEILQIR